jgi:hypothetical protein
VTSCCELFLLFNASVNYRIHNYVQYSISIAEHFCQAYNCDPTHTNTTEAYKPTKEEFVELESISPLSYSV